MSANKRNPLLTAIIGASALAACVSPGPAQTQDRPLRAELPVRAAPTYADLVDLALASELVAVVLVDEQIVVPPERAPDVAPGSVRLYVESLTQRLLAAPGAMGESVTFLVDQQRDAKGDAPELEELSFVFFGATVPGQPGFAQLLSSDSLFPADPVIEERVRRVLTQLAAADALPPVTGVKDVISVPGNLAGESETQLFIETDSRAPLSISVIRRPGAAPEWGLSLGEIVDQNARPPERETIAWYRLACELPSDLADDAFLQSDRESQDRARADYAFVQAQLGPCERRLPQM